jgi:hypothetical protein
MCVCASSQPTVSYETYSQTQNTTSTCNAFSVSGIIRILQTTHHKSASVPEQHMPEFPNLLHSNATRNCSQILTAPKPNTHAAVSVAKKCNIRSTCVCGSAYCALQHVQLADTWNSAAVDLLSVVITYYCKLQRSVYRRSLFEQRQLN